MITKTRNSLIYETFKLGTATQNQNNSLAPPSASLAGTGAGGDVLPDREHDGGSTASTVALLLSTTFAPRKVPASEAEGRASELF